MTTIVIQLTVTWLQQHGPGIQYTVYDALIYLTHFSTGAIGLLSVMLIPCLNCILQLCMWERWTDQSFELWLLLAAIKISLPLLAFPDQHFLWHAVPKCTLCLLLLHSHSGHYISSWQQQMLLPPLESPLYTECQWADLDSVLVLMFYRGYFQTTLLTVAAENKNWLYCATVVRLWDTGHWSKAWDLCLLEWIAAWMTEEHIFHMQGSGFLCCRCFGSY